MAKLSDKDKAYLLTLRPEDIKFSLLLSLFADKSNRTGRKVIVVPSRMQTSDEFILEKGEYFNKERVNTNAGLFIYNKLIVERELANVLGYVNTPINSGALGKIEKKLSDALLTDRITVEAFVNYLNRTQWLAKQFHSVISGSFTMNTLKPSNKVIKERDKLLKENREKISQGDVITSVKIEKQLLEIADNELSDDHGLDLYKSGARGSFGNNFKNISVMKGSVFNPTTGKFDIVESNFMEGIRKEELSTYGNAIITGAYPKAIGTATSGYFSKQIIAALQAVTLDKKGSDCGSIGYLRVRIPEDRVEDYRYRYIAEGSKLTLLDDNNIGNYVGKEVKLRSPMYCTSKNLCRVCAGLMYEKLQIDNIGMTAARVSSTLLNLSMKKFHDSSAKLSKIKPETIVL